jgi:hypothetical protein
MWTSIFPGSKSGQIEDRLPSKGIADRDHEIGGNERLYGRRMPRCRRKPECQRVVFRNLTSSVVANGI